jgi:hypothetical protein
MFTLGPLHVKRFEIVEQLKPIVQTGDILYRASNAKGPFGIPFSRLVMWLSNSKYSHASVILVEDGEINVVEINDEGTIKLRLIDWLDLCYTPEFSIYRLKKPVDITKEIQDFLAKDPEYDFYFNDENKFYCTESVVAMYVKAGVRLILPQKIKEVVPKWAYVLLSIGNFFVKNLSSAGLPLDKSLYYVGNENQGLMSSELTNLILHYELK